jgi:NADPH:quinone reductase-like Zn-dependent oxidoreductase
VDYGPDEFRNPEKVQTPPRKLFIPLHDSERRQLTQISSLIEAGAIRPVVDRGFQFEKINEALAYVETGRAKGKVVVTVT